jgi:hypothetical protein
MDGSSVYRLIGDIKIEGGFVVVEEIERAKIWMNGS